MKKIIGLVLVIGLGFVIYGCGQIGTGGGGSTTNYTVSGKVGTITTSGIKAAAADSVTHIVAIGADNSKTLATYSSSEGTFTLDITSGQPYVLGFYNKSGGTITLLGYLKQDDVDWDSLPVISPTGSSTDVGTIEIDATSVEATTTVSLTALAAAMGMDTATATYYGLIDDTLSALTNLDVDGNGEFDFQESKNYLFQTFIGMYETGSPATGEIDSMLDGYNDTYKPIPSFYQIYLSCFSTGDARATGTSATLTPPSALGGALTQTATTGALSTGWSLFFPSVTTPEVAPAGTYTVAIGSTTYTVRNFKASDVVAMQANNNIIYPVFHLVTNEANKITKVQYVWKKLVSGAITAADSAQVLASINYDASATSSTQNPFISFFSGANTLYTGGGSGLFTLNISSTEVDVSSLNISKSDIHHIQAGYELTSKVICKFDLY